MIKKSGDQNMMSTDNLERFGYMIQMMHKFPKFAQKVYDLHSQLGEKCKWTVNKVYHYSYIQTVLTHYLDIFCSIS